MKRSPITRRPSKAKRDFDAEYARELPRVLARGCEFHRYAAEHGLGLAGEWPPLTCRGRLIGHHAQGRRVADANAPEKLRCLCDGHHQFVHAHPRWSREVGLMLSRTA